MVGRVKVIAPNLVVIRIHVKTVVHALVLINVHVRVIGMVNIVINHYALITVRTEAYANNLIHVSVIRNFREASIARLVQIIRGANFAFHVLNAFTVIVMH